MGTGPGRDAPGARGAATGQPITNIGADRASRAASIALAVTCLLGALNYMDRMLLSAVLPGIKDEFGLSDTELGSLAMSFAIFYSTLGIPISRIADRGSRRNVVAAAAFVWSAMTALCGVATSFSSLFLARIGVAIGEAGFMPASYSLLSDYFSPTRRNLVLGLLNAINSLGVVAGLALGGVIAAQYGWRSVFLILGAPGMLLAFSVLIFVREPRRGAMDGTRSGVAQQGILHELGALWANEPFRWITITSAFNAFCALGMVQWLPSFLHRTHHLDIGTIGVIFGIPFGLGLALGQFLGGIWATRLARTHVFAPLFQCVWTNLVSALCLLGVLWVPRADIAIVLIVSACFVSGLGQPAQAGGTQNALPQQLRATGAAITGLGCNLVGLGLGPLCVGFLSDSFRDRAGDDSLRWALSMAQALLVLASYAGWRAYRVGLAHRLERAG